MLFETTAANVLKTFIEDNGVIFESFVPEFSSLNLTLLSTNFICGFQVILSEIRNNFTALFTVK